jgi:hypothetical protein
MHQGLNALLFPCFVPGDILLSIAIPELTVSNAGRFPDRFGDFTGNRLFLIGVRAKRPDMAYHKAYRMREGWEPDTSSSVAYTDKGVPDEG